MAAPLIASLAKKTMLIKDRSKIPKPAVNVIKSNPGLRWGLIAGMIMFLVMIIIVVYIVWGGMNDSSDDSIATESPDVSPPYHDPYPDGKDAPYGYRRTAWTSACTSCKSIKDNDVNGVCSDARVTWDMCHVDESNALQICNSMQECGGYKCGIQRGSKTYCYLIDNLTASTYWSSHRNASDFGKMYIKKSTEPKATS